MKRYIALLLCLVMIFTMLVSCKKDDTNDEEAIFEGDSETVREDDDDTEDVKKEEKPDDSEKVTTPPKKEEPDKKEDTDPDTPVSNESSDNNSTTMDKFDKEDSNVVTENTDVPEIKVEPTPPAEDADLSEIEFDKSDGEIDQTAQNSHNDVKYETEVLSNIEELVLSKSDFDETKLTLPVMKIDTLDKTPVTSKNTYKNATITVTNSSKCTLTNYGVEIRGRGNSTWSFFEKKAYKLRFPVAQDLFGMGAGKKWVLLANALDETMLRNYLTLTYAKSIGCKFATDCQFVSLMLNGEYQGVYLLCEQVQEGKNRVDVNTSKTGEVDTGYFLEGINNLSAVDYKTFRLNDVDGKHLGTGNFQFIVKSPNKLECTGDQLSFIHSIVSDANEAIFKKDWAKIQETCDVDSFVNLFLVNEISLNNDMGYSFYLYREKGGKLSIGPVWDYDQAMGSSSHGGSTYKGWYAGSKLQWFTTLIEIPEFKELVKQKYLATKATADSLVTRVDSTVTKYRYDFAMDNALWANYGAKRWRITPELIKLKSYKEHATYLKTWITNRLRWMESDLSI